MKRKLRPLRSSLLILHLLSIGLLILSAYSPYLNPTTLPLLANIGLGFPILVFVQVLFLVLWLVIDFKKTQYSLITLLIIAPQLYKYSPINIKHTPAQESIKVLSYNVMGFGGLVKDKQGNNKVLDYLRNSQADIICLQEYSSSTNTQHVTKKDILKALANYPYYQIHQVGATHSGNHLALFSKFPIEEANNLDLESSYNGAVAYTLTIKGEKVLLINCHLESNKITREDKAVYARILKLENKGQLIKDTKSLYSKFVEAALIRQKQAEKVDNIVKFSKLPYVIVCGDFNDTPLSYTNRVLEASLTNAFVQSGCGLGISYNQNKFFFRIDNILISKNLKAYNCQVDRSIKASDHYPIWSYIAN